MRASSWTFLALVMCATACDAGASTLTVRVQSGLRAGHGIRFVSAELHRGAACSGDVVAAPAGTVVEPADQEALASGSLTVAEVSGLASGVYSVFVRARRPPDTAAERPDDGSTLLQTCVAVSVAQSRVVRVVLSGECIGLVCPMPGGSAGFDQCLNARCVDPRCDPDDPATAIHCCDRALLGDTCDTAPTVCRGDGDCAAGAACAGPPRCVSGACLQGEDTCPRTTWCDPESETCEPEAALDTHDAGTVDGGELADASIDAPPDAFVGEACAATAAGPIDEDGDGLTDEGCEYFVDTVHSIYGLDFHNQAEPIGERAESLIVSGPTFVNGVPAFALFHATRANMNAAYSEPRPVSFTLDGAPDAVNHMASFVRVGPHAGRHGVAQVGVGTELRLYVIAGDPVSGYATVGAPLPVPRGYLDIAHPFLTDPVGPEARRWLFVVARTREEPTGEVYAGRVDFDPSGEPAIAIGALVRVTTTGDYLLPSVDPDGLVLFVERPGGVVLSARRASVDAPFPEPTVVGAALYGAFSGRPIFVPATREVFMRGGKRGRVSRDVLHPDVFAACAGTRIRGHSCAMLVGGVGLLGGGGAWSDARDGCGPGHLLAGIEDVADFGAGAAGSDVPAWIGASEAGWVTGEICPPVDIEAGECASLESGSVVARPCSERVSDRVCEIEVWPTWTLGP